MTRRKMQLKEAEWRINYFIESSLACIHDNINL